MGGDMDIKKNGVKHISSIETTKIVREARGKG
jgi:hypothetical protein